MIIFILLAHNCAQLQIFCVIDDTVRNVIYNKNQLNDIGDILCATIVSVHYLNTKLPILTFKIYRKFCTGLLG